MIPTTTCSFSDFRFACVLHILLCLCAPCSHLGMGRVIILT